MEHSIVHYDPEKWCAVPANNGGNGPTWQWGNELLVGFTMGTFAKVEKGHQCTYDRPFDSWLARSTDGGESWISWKPPGYVGQEGIVAENAEELDFRAPGFAMRVEGAGYHGNAGARWFHSNDRGSSWSAPFGFGSLLSHPELAGREFTARTAYIVDGPRDLSLFLSVRDKSSDSALGVSLTDKTFLARTDDGCCSFSFVSWVLPWDDPCRAVMPAPARLSESELVVALRRKSESENWIDCCGSGDNGSSWSFLSKVGHTEDASSFNGNPPALVALEDGRICCVYGNRSERRMVARFSEDRGKTWSEAKELRSDFGSANDWPDLGYPRLFQRPDGKLVAAYFWCTPDKPQTHIEGTVF